MKKFLWLFCGLTICFCGYSKASNKSNEEKNSKKHDSFAPNRSKISMKTSNADIPAPLMGVQARSDNYSIRSTRIGTDGHNDDIRPMAAGVYDRENNLTYMVYMNTTGDGNAYVVTCDHNNNDTWDKGHTVGVADQDDNHNYPQIVLPNDNRPVVVYGAHNIPLKIAKMNTAGDPSAWTTRVLSKADDGSYPMPIVARNGDIYIFYRVTVANVVRPMYFIKSTDNGLTWSDPVMAIQRAVDREGFREIYVGMIAEEPYRTGINQRFHFTWTLAGASIPANNHDWAREGLYHAYFEPETERFYAADGTLLGTSVDENDMDRHCEIVAPQRSPLREGYMGYDPKVAVSENGEILVWEFHNSGRWQDVVHFFNGNDWQVQPARGLSVYPKGIDYFNGKHYFIGNSRDNIFQGTSNNGVSFTNDYGFSMSGAQSGIPTVTIPIKKGHPAARFWAKETAGEPTNVWAGAVTGSGLGIPAALQTSATGTKVAPGSNFTIRAYVCDKVGGGYGRVTSATNSVSLKLVSGDASIVSAATVNAVNGKAAFSVRAGTGHCVFAASSTGLDPSYIHIYSTSNSASQPKLQILNYPTDPVADVFKATFFSATNASVTAQILNNGQTVEQILVNANSGNNNSVSFNVLNLEPGAYTLKLSNGSSVSTCSFSKKDMSTDFVLNKCFPNPTPDLHALELLCNKSMTLPIVVYDQGNSAVMQEEFELTKGYNKIVLNLSLLKVGMYTIVLDQGKPNEIKSEVSKIE